MRRRRPRTGEFEPVTLAPVAGSMGESRQPRRFILLDGTAKCHPQPCDPNILQVEGPIDPDWWALRLLRMPVKVVAASSPHIRHLKGSWLPEQLRHWRLDRRLGREYARALGRPMRAAGDQWVLRKHPSHRPYESKPASRPSRDEGATPPETTHRVLATMEPISVEDAKMRHSVVPLPRRVPDDATLADARKLLEANPEPMWLDEARTQVSWDWIYAINVLDLDDDVRESPIFSYEIHTLSLGSLNLIGLMGEPFVEAQLAIKFALGNTHTFIAHLCNGSAGYLPTHKAFEGGGFETRLRLYIETATRRAFDGHCSNDRDGRRHEWYNAASAPLRIVRGNKNVQ